MKSLALAFILSIVSGSVFAEELMVNSPGDGFLNLREGPSSNHPIIIEMYHGQTAEVLSISGNWLQVRHQSGTTGWAYGKNLIPVSSAKSQLRVNSPNDGYLNLRSGPSANHQIIRQMEHGSRASVIGRSGDWLQVQHDSGSTGWAHSKYLNTSISPRATASNGQSNSQGSSGSSSRPTGGGLFGSLLRGGLRAIGGSESSRDNNFSDKLSDPKYSYCLSISNEDARHACLEEPWLTDNEDARKVLLGDCYGMSQTAQDYGLMQVCAYPGKNSCSAIQNSDVAYACYSCNGTRRWVATAAAGHVFECLN